MARNVLSILLLCLASSSVLAGNAFDCSEHHGYSSEEQERRWNTPPELIPEEVVKTTKHEHSGLLLGPIKANIKLGSGANAQSLGVGLGPDGLSLSQSNSFSGSKADGGPLALGSSSSLSLGPKGLAASNARALNVGDEAKAKSNSFSLGDAGAASHAKAEKGRVMTDAQSNVGSVASGAASGAATGAGHTKVHRIHVESQERPHWTNIRPNYEIDDHYHSHRPSVEIIAHHGHRTTTERPIKLYIGSYETRRDDSSPEIHISKWHPHRAAHRPHLRVTDDWSGHRGHSLESSASSSSSSSASSGDRSSSRGLGDATVIAVPVHHQTSGSSAKAEAQSKAQSSVNVEKPHWHHGHWHGGSSVEKTQAQAQASASAQASTVEKKETKHLLPLHVSGEGGHLLPGLLNIIG